MKKWNNIVLENNGNVSFSIKNDTGSSFYKHLEPIQQRELLKKLKSSNDANIKKFIDELKAEDGYTPSITVNYNNFSFGMYGVDGVISLSKGGPYPSGAKLDNLLDIDEFISAI